MVNKATLELPNGSQRTYKEGGPVRILPGCPELPEGGEGVIYAFPDDDRVAVLLADGRVTNSIPIESLYLEPAGVVDAPKAA